MISCLPNSHTNCHPLSPEAEVCLQPPQFESNFWDTVSAGKWLPFRVIIWNLEIPNSLCRNVNKIIGNKADVAEGL